MFIHIFFIRNLIVKFIIQNKKLRGRGEVVELVIQSIAVILMIKAGYDISLTDTGDLYIEYWIYIISLAVIFLTSLANALRDYFEGRKASNGEGKKPSRFSGFVIFAVMTFLTVGLKLYEPKREINPENLLMPKEIQIEYKGSSRAIITDEKLIRTIYDEMTSKELVNLRGISLLNSTRRRHGKEFQYALNPRTGDSISSWVSNEIIHWIYVYEDNAAIMSQHKEFNWFTFLLNDSFYDYEVTFSREVNEAIENVIREHREKTNK